MEAFSAAVSSTAKRHPELTSEWASPAHRREGHWERKKSLRLEQRNRVKTTCVARFG